MDKETTKSDKRWLRRVWQVLPMLSFFILVAVIVVLFTRIQTESADVKARKTAALKQERPEVNVVTLAMAPALIRDRISLPGEITPWIDLKVMAEVRGTLSAKKVREGQTVSKGTALYQVDNRDYVNAHSGIKASYQAAVKELKRQRGLFKQNIGTRSQIDDLEARVASLKANLDSAAINVARCTIRSPIEGFVNRVYLEKGEYVNVGDAIAEILQMDQVKVVVGIPESDVAAVRKLDTFDLTVDALDGQRFRGRKHFLSHTVDQMARLYDLSIRIDNPERQLLPGMFVRVEIVKSQVADGLAIPLYAAISRQGEHIVYVVDSQRQVTSRAVEFGIQEGWRVQVTQGLDVGEEVIVMGQRSVNNGDRVNVVRTARTYEEITQ